eukprot:scaffold232940_cov24-Tisochrysis_lutea.AAC.1
MLPFFPKLQVCGRPSFLNHDTQGLLPYDMFATKLLTSPARMLALEPEQKVVWSPHGKTHGVVTFLLTLLKVAHHSGYHTGGIQARHGRGLPWQDPLPVLPQACVSAHQLGWIPGPALCPEAKACARALVMMTWKILKNCALSRSWSLRAYLCCLLTGTAPVHTL